jgi:hypothetical protein
MKPHLLLAKQKASHCSTMVSHNTAVVDKGMAICANLALFLVVHNTLVPCVGVAFATIIDAPDLQRVLFAVLVRRAVGREAEMVPLGVVMVKRMGIFCLWININILFCYWREKVLDRESLTATGLPNNPQIDCILSSLINIAALVCGFSYNYSFSIDIV